jgi:transcription initiation factor TFIID subunit 1
VATPTSLAQAEGEESAGGKETGNFESAIPYLIPKDMTMEQLHAKVKGLFPGFVPNSVLRFCTLLGPPKISVAAKLWAGARRPPKRPPRTEEVEWKFNFGPPPPPGKLLDSDEKSFLRSEHVKAGAVESGSGSAQSSVQVDPETQAWRFGPAQMWYDALGLPEDGQGLDYGFKLKVSSAVQ